MGSENTTLTKTTAPLDNSSKEGADGGMTMTPPAFGLTANPIQRATPDNKCEELPAEEQFSFGEPENMCVNPTPEEALAALKALTGEPLKSLLKQNTDAITAKGFLKEDLAALSTVFGFKPAKTTYDEAMMEAVAQKQYDSNQYPTGLMDDAFYGASGVKSAVSKSRFDGSLVKEDKALATTITQSQASLQKLVDDKKITTDDVAIVRMILANTPDLVKKAGDSKKHADDSVTVDSQLVKFLMDWQVKNSLLVTGVFDAPTVAAFAPVLAAAKAKLLECGYSSMEGAVADLQVPVAAADQAAYLDALIADNPSSNQKLAQWLWKAAKLGFLDMSGRAKEDLIQLMSGTAFNQMQGSGSSTKINADFVTDGPLFTGLVMDRSVIMSYMTAWKADMTKPKKVLGLNSLATWDREGTPNQRRTGQHGNFKAMDYALTGGQIDKFKELLAGMPKGTYGLGIGVMSGFYQNPKYLVPKGKNEVRLPNDAINTEKVPMEEAYGKVYDMDEVLKAVAKPEELKAVPTIGGGSTLDDTDRTNLTAAVKAYVDGKADPAKAPALLGALKKQIAAVQAKRDGFNTSYLAEKAKLDAIIPIDTYHTTQLKIDWQAWDNKARKWSYGYAADPSRVTKMDNEASFTQIMTKEVYDAVKAWIATGQKLEDIYPDNPNHLHADAKK